MKIYDSKGREIKSPAKTSHPQAGVMRKYEEILFGCASEWAHVELPRGKWGTPKTHELVFVEYVDPDGFASRYWAAWPIGEAEKAATPPAESAEFAESIAQKWAREREEAARQAAIKAAEKAKREALENARQETLSTIRELFPKLVYSNRRGDLGGWYPEKVWKTFPDHIACFIGGVSANVVTDSESGLSWDLGDSYSGKWTLHPSMISDSVDGQNAITAELRERAARQAAEKLATDLKRVRENWRTIDPHGWAADGLGPEARVLLRRIHSAQKSAAWKKTLRLAKKTRQRELAERQAKRDAAKASQPEQREEKQETSRPVEKLDDKFGTLEDLFAGLNL